MTNKQPESAFASAVMEHCATMMMDPLKKKTRLYEDIVQQFMRKIESGELKAGDRLPTERELVEQLGVSRTSIREALRAMELLGVIESKVSEGTFIKHSGIDGALLRLSGVAGADENRVMEMYEIRILLETYSIRQAAKKRNERHLREMREAIEVLKGEIAGGTRGQSGDNLFHRTIAEAAGNSVLISILSLFAETIDSSIAVSNANVNVNDIIDEHQSMYEAIEARDEKTAEKLMRAHIKRAHARVKFIAGKSDSDS